MLKLVEINEQNWLDVRRLSVSKDQEGFLDSAVGILARGYVYRGQRARVLGIERDGEMIGIALVKDYWNQGIGTVMMQEMIRIAEANPDILQVELDFIEGNTRARALYEKMGFRITDVRPNAIRLKDGTLLNEYSMIREIKRD